MQTLLEWLSRKPLKEGKRLIFTQYAEMGALIKDHLCQTFAVEMPFLYGGTSRKKRDIMIRDFQDSTHPSAFILSYSVWVPTKRIYTMPVL